MAAGVYIGIAGWSYPDWKGIVYTKSGIDQLEYVAGFVDTIEINNTFYHPPAAKTCKSWLARVAGYPDFFFTAKLGKEFTHEGRIDPVMVKEFHEGFEPILDTGKLRKLLMQFKYDFTDTDFNRAYLEELVKHFRNTFSIAVEVRHVSWQQEQALAFMNGLGVTVCNLDYPVSSTSFNMPRCTVGKDGYLRLHGRNTAKWFSKASRDEVYNYCYSEEELIQIRNRIDELAKAFDSLTVIANNHYRGGELANAIELKAMLTNLPQPVPEGLIKEYPRLARIARKANLF